MAKSLKSRDSDSMSRWSEYLNAEESSPSTSTPSSGAHQKGLHMESVVQLSKVAEGLLSKIYKLYRVLDSPDVASHAFSDAFWMAGVLPNFPRLCVLLSKKFPEHPNKLQLERVRFVWLIWGCFL